MDEQSLEERLTAIQSLLKQCLGKGTAQRSAQTEVHLQEAFEHIRSARSLSDESAANGSEIASAIGDGETEFGDDLDAGWISADEGSIVTLEEWR